jgi:hypothetical protein
VKYKFRPTCQTPTFSQPMTVFHGTYPECFARIAHTRKLHCSDIGRGLGMESHTRFPAVYTADTLHHALQYSWPSNFLLDNLYYGIMFELEADSTKVLMRHRGEVLLPPDAIVIRSVYLLLNLDVAKGSAKNAEWDDNLEILPDDVRGGRNSLEFYPLRRTAWHTVP